jgi:hypothetical protein
LLCTYLWMATPPATRLMAPRNGACGRTHRSHAPAATETAPNTAPASLNPEKVKIRDTPATPHTDSITTAAAKAREAIPNPLDPIYHRRNT